VADGMGGHGGEEASRIATQVIQAYFVEHWNSDKPNPALLEGALFQANQAIVQSQHLERSEMGTTAVAVMFGSNSLGYVGDSPPTASALTSLSMTEDHTWCCSF